MARAVVVRVAAATFFWVLADGAVLLLFLHLLLAGGIVRNGL